MTPSRWQQIEEIYQAALKLGPGDRTALLASVDPGLRRGVESLLEQPTSGEGRARPSDETATVDSTLTKVGIGTQLGPYKIEAPIGKGGMGQVFRAVDTRLGRKVAIKVSNQKFDERFEREARAISSLNHPHICTLHDIGPNYLVMELVEGETLAAHLRKGPLALDEALRYGAEIAEALAAAHAEGIVHRDLKPANIMLAKNGVKVLDFGLAKSQQDQTMTARNVIMGTPAYMAPEQLAGTPCDARADIYAFGLVLHEMLAGKRFQPGQKQEVEGIPPRVSHVNERCLAPDPEDRWQSAHDVKIGLELAVRASIPDSAERSQGRPHRVAYVLAVIATGIAVTLALVHFRERPQEAGVVRSSIAPPEKASFASLVAVSPDGRRLAYGASRDGGKDQLWVRSLDALVAQPLAGTEDAANPFWSPDSRFLGFFAEGKLKRIDASGGPTLTLSDAPNPRGGTWNRGGVIIFAPNIQSPLYRVSAAGGDSSPITKLGQGGSYLWPWFLPDGRNFLYEASDAGGNAPSRGIIRVASLDANGDFKDLVESQFNAVYVQRYLLFLRGSTLMAQPFDTKRLATAGDAVPIAEQVHTSTNLVRGDFSVSENGLLVYRTGTQRLGAQLAWLDRSGKPIAKLGDPGVFGTMNLSQDGKTVSVSMSDTTTRNRDIWLYDVVSGRRTRFTFDQAEEREQTWSPDSRTIVFNSNRRGHFDLYRKASSGAGVDELLYADDADKYPTSYSPDGKFLLYFSEDKIKGDSKTKLGVWVLPMTGERKPFPFVLGENPRFSPYGGRFSPDGRWVAYVSYESRRGEVYIAPFRCPAGVPCGKRQISTGGGTDPIWRRDGKEVFYVAPDHLLMAAEVNATGDVPEVRVVRPLFGPLGCAGGRCFEVSGDGQQFLVRTEPEQATPEPLTLVQNWSAGLKK